MLCLQQNLGVQCWLGRTESTPDGDPRLCVVITAEVNFIVALQSCLIFIVIAIVQALMNALILVFLLLASHFQRAYLIRHSARVFTGSCLWIIFISVLFFFEVRVFCVVFVC